jgi:hypothetical protein
MDGSVWYWGFFWNMYCSLEQEKRLLCVWIF